MKNKKMTYVYITLLTVAILLLISLLIFGLSKKNFNFNFGYNVSTNKIIDRVYEQTFKDIDIIANASQIEIRRSIDNNARVVVYGDIKNIQTDATDDKLTIVSREKDCKFFCFKRTISKIEVYLPNIDEKKLHIDNKYGDVFVDDLPNINLNANLKAGDIEVLAIKEAIIKNSYGDIKIGKASTLDIKANCGDISITEAKDANIINEYGDIEIRNITNYLSIDEKCGDVDIDKLSLNESSSIKNSYGDVTIGITNQIYIDAKTSLGDVKIRNNYPKADISLTIKDSLGDIEVNN